MKRKGIAIAFLCVFAVMALTACGSRSWEKDYSAYIEIGDYTGLETDKVSFGVTEAELTEEIYDRLEAAKTVKDITTGTVEDGDVVNIDYVGKMNGKKFEDGSAKDYDLTIGSGEFIDGFEDGLVGKEVGSEVKLDLTFPKNYSHDDLAGKDVTFDVTINSKQIDIVPDLDDAFAKQNGADNVADYRKQVRQELYEKEKKDALTEERNALWSQVLENSSVKKDNDGAREYPEEELDRVEDEVRDMYESYAKEYGMTLEDFAMQQMNMDSETFDEQLAEYAKTAVKEEMVVYTIASMEGISLSDDDIQEYIDNQLNAAGYDQETFEKSEGKSYIEVYGEDNVYMAAYKEKVLDLIYEKAEIK